MRRLVALLSLTTAIFAGSTLYLVWKSHHELPVVQPTQAAAPVTPAPVTAQTSAGTNVPAETEPPVKLAKASTPKKSTAVSPQSEQRQRELEYDRQFIQQSADPAGRRKLLEERKVDLRRQYPGLQAYLGLDDDAFERMLDLLAEQQIGEREALLRCQQNHGCAVRVMEEARDSQPRELSTLIGTDKMGRFDAYQKGLQDRQTVVELRGRLSDADHLGDTQAESLVEALVDERQRISEDMAQSSEVAGLNMFGIPFVLSQDVTGSELLEQARTYQARLRARAAKVLSPAQLAAYDQMLAEQLNSLGYTLEATAKSMNWGH